MNALGDLEKGWLSPKAIKEVGFPIALAVVLIGFLMYVGYFIVRYEVFFNREKVEAMSTEIGEMSMQHGMILEGQTKSLRIQCATCWNGADGEDEIKRCGCDPSPITQ